MYKNPWMYLSIGIKMYKTIQLCVLTKGFDR